MNITANTIKKELRENGFSTKNISVRVKSYGYGNTSINVTIKNLDINAVEVFRFLRQKYLEIRYDEFVQGEILEWCNTLVSCDYDYFLLQNAIENKKEEAEKIYAALEQDELDQGIEIFKNDTVTAYAFINENCISLWNNDRENYTLNRGHVLYNANDLARALVKLETSGNFNRY